MALQPHEDEVYKDLVRRVNIMVAYMIIAFIILFMGNALALLLVSNNTSEDNERATKARVALCEVNNRTNRGAIKFIDNSLAASHLSNTAIVNAPNSTHEQVVAAKLRLSQLDDIHRGAVEAFQVTDCSKL